MNRLLTASGSSLPGLIDEALRWLVVHQGNSVDLSVLVTLGVADALGDTEARDWARKQIALLRPGHKSYRWVIKPPKIVNIKEAS